MKLKNNNGITLIALVITIIVLLILAGVSINMISSDDGIITRASDATEKTKANSDAEEQKLKDTADYIDEKVNQYNDGSASDSSLSHSGTIPEGAYYANLNTATFYDVMPDTVNNLDIYLYNEYLYAYIEEDSGWNVMLATADLELAENVTLSSILPEYSFATLEQVSYGEILNTINNKPIVAVNGLYYSCTNLKESPKIPDTVTKMSATFNNCTSLEKAPKLPSNLAGQFGLEWTFHNCTSLKTYENSTDADGDFSNYIIPNSGKEMEMNGTFSGCILMESAPTIPSNVTYFGQVFENCTNLTGTVIINTNPTSCYNAFTGTVKPITITGSCSAETKASLAATATNDNVTY